MNSRKFIEETNSKVEEIKKSMILFEKSHHKLSTLVSECDSTNRRTLGLYFKNIWTSEETSWSDSHTGKIGDINREISNLSKEMFEIKILVNENKDADDKNQAAVNKKLQDIFSAKGNVNDQLNNLLYMLTNAEVLSGGHKTMLNFC